MSTVEYEDVYDDVLNKIEKNDVGDVYSEIMTKEKVTLDTLKRLKKKKDEKEELNKSMTNSTVHTVVYRVFITILDIFNDLISMQPLNMVFKVERRIYIGIFLIFISVCFIILYKV